MDVLELPYIFGDPIWGKPLWYPLVMYIRATPLVFFMRGGTACNTAKTVGKAAFSAIENGRASTIYPIGQENLTWTQILTRLAHPDGRAVKVVTLPSWFIKVGMFRVFFAQTLQGKEAGLSLRHFSALQTAHTFLDPDPSQ